MIQKDYLERCYAGWLGKIIGVRLGAPVESWSRDDIQKRFGEITYYVQEYHDFAADDDTNGPMFYLRALNDYGLDATPEQMGKTLLNYVPYEHGFYWWGGYGHSTEHTSYLNLRAGIPAPLSGSIAQNGTTIAEQIGGQIFVDTWGLVNPANPDRAADYAQRAASVSHDGNGIYGARFVAACIAAAFELNDTRKIMERALLCIPEDCEYSRVVRDMIRFYDVHGGTWENAFQYIRACWGYDRYPGHCHIIPNSAVMAMSMLYGENDFARTLCICTMCGWDTDCNAGNVGAIMGAMVGLEGIEDRWLAPIHDFLANSSVIGSLNIMDAPECVQIMARLAYDLEGEAYPEKWAALLRGECARYHFELPRSTHSFRMEEKGALSNSDLHAHSGLRSLKIDCAEKEARVYLKTYYTNKDFSDSRYDPAFSPILYPGQKISVWLRPEDGRKDVTAHLWAGDGEGNVLCQGEWISLPDGQWTRLEMTVKCDPAVAIHRAGIAIQGDCSPVLYLDDMDFSGKADYQLDFSRMQMHFWYSFHVEVPQCTYLRGQWRIENKALWGSGTDHCETYTGYYFWKDIAAETTFIPCRGEKFRFLFRLQGAERCYAATLEKGKLSIEKKDGAYVSLVSVPLEWQEGHPITLSISAQGNQLEACAGDVKAVCQDDAYTYGQIGWGLENGRMQILRAAVQAE